MQAGPVCRKGEPAPLSSRKVPWKTSLEKRPASARKGGRAVRAASLSLIAALSIAQGGAIRFRVFYASGTTSLSASATLRAAAVMERSSTFTVISAYFS